MLSKQNTILGAAAFILLSLTAGAALAADGGTGDVSADVVMLAAYVLLALVCSFLCSVAEAVLLSITPSYIAGLQETQPKKAALLKRLKQDDVDHSLAAILTLNTIAHTVGAIGAGAKAAVVFGSAWLGIFSALMTLAILVLTEIIPKTLGAIYWSSLAGATAVFVRGLIMILYPLIFVSDKVTKLIARGKSVHVFSRDEFVALASIGEQAGHINERESRIIQNLFRFGSLRAEDIMTPRTVILAFPEEMTVREALERRPSIAFSRLPIYRENIDEITGFVLKDDILQAKGQGQGGEKLEAFKREILTVIAEKPLTGLLELLLEKGQHIALVVGEHGEIEGVVTLEDVVETLLGMEIVDEMDTVEDMRVLARQRWAKRVKALGLEVEVKEKGNAAQDHAGGGESDPRTG